MNILIDCRCDGILELDLDFFCFHMHYYTAHKSLTILAISAFRIEALWLDYRVYQLDWALASSNVYRAFSNLFG